MSAKDHSALYGSVLIALVLSLCTHDTIFAQLRPYALPSSKQTAQTKANANVRGKALTPRELPFWDDFSGTPVNVPGNKNSNLPVDSLWVTVPVNASDTSATVFYRNVWINNGIGINPPSINVATFDGLRSDFLPYSDQASTNGIRDILESQPILLGDPNVTLAERNTVFLSFYFQWGGHGEAPDPSDFLQVEFKDTDGKWEPVMKILPRRSFQITEFYDTLLRVDGEKFFHDAFQFRFVNYGRLSGPYDTWNIDYVYLNKNRNASEIGFPDQAAASSLTGLFSNYQSMPYHHFRTSGAIQSPTFDVRNVLNEFTDVTYLTQATFRNYSKDEESGVKTLLSETYVSNLGGTDTSAINADGSGIIFPLEKRAVTLQYAPDAANTSQFDPAANATWVNLKVQLFTGDTFDPRTGGLANDYDVNYLPIDFRVNDTISAQYWLDDYYAYDDGVAEYAAGLTQAGNRAALQFNMLTDVPDTLVAFDVYAPDYGLVSNLSTDFYVYDDNNGVPGEIIYSRSSVVLLPTGTNTFQRVEFGEPFLVEKTFYIGWRAPVGGILKIGLDYNNDSGDRIFVNTTGTWLNDADIPGSLMIRPVFGKATSNISGAEDERLLGIYPNPSNGEFNLNAAFDTISILTLTGQEVPFSLESATQGHRIRLHQPASGLYIVKLVKGNKISTGKIIVK